MGMGRTLNERRWSFWLILYVSLALITLHYSLEMLFTGHNFHVNSCSFLASPQLVFMIVFLGTSGMWLEVSVRKVYMSFNLFSCCQTWNYMWQGFVTCPHVLPCLSERETPIDPWEIKKTLDASSLSLFSSSDTGSLFLDFLWLVTGNSRAMHFTGKSSDSPRLVLSLLTPKDFLLTLCSKWSKETKK